MLNTTTTEMPISSSDFEANEARDCAESLEDGMNHRCPVPECEEHTAKWDPAQPRRRHYCATHAARWGVYGAR